MLYEIQALHIVGSIKDYYDDDDDDSDNSDDDDGCDHGGGGDDDDELPASFPQAWNQCWAWNQFQLVEKLQIYNYHFNTYSYILTFQISGKFFEWYADDINVFATMISLHFPQNHEGNF